MKKKIEKIKKIVIIVMMVKKCTIKFILRSKIIATMIEFKVMKEANARFHEHQRLMPLVSNVPVLIGP